MRGESQVAEDVDDSFDVNIIEESRDVEEDDGGDEVAFNGGLGVVYKAESCIGCAVVVV